jgi:hypothetical protein
MRYLILIHSVETGWGPDEPEGRRWMQAYIDYVTDLRKRDKLVESAQLEPAAGSKQVTVVNGKRTVVDGPFADTKEQVGGFFLVDVADEAEAIELAAQCPGAQHGRIELRKLRQRG